MTTLPIEAPLENNELQLTSQYRLGVDKMNYILSKRYQKRSGKGRNAEFINEYAYDKANASYFGNPKSLANRLVDKDFLEGMNIQDLSKVEDVVTAINNAVAHMDKNKAEIYEHLNSHITIDLGETSKKAPKQMVKGMEISSGGEE